MGQFVATGMATTPETITSSPAYLTGFTFIEISGSGRTVNISNGSGDGDIVFNKIPIVASSKASDRFYEGGQLISFPSGIYASASDGGVGAVITYI